MKNERGQVLVIFVILLPLLLLALAVVVDSSYLLYQKNHLDNINRDILNSIKDSNDVTEKEIRNLISKNDSRIVIDNIVIADDITIEDYFDIDSLFGRLIGIKSYHIQSKKSVSYTINSNYLVLDINSLNPYDNTNNYLVNNYNVVYDNGLVFNSSMLTVENFVLPENYKVNISFKYLGDGNLITFNDFIISINNNILHFGNYLTYALEPNNTYTLEISNKLFSINGDEIPIKYITNSSKGTLYIGAFLGKIDFLRIYELENK